VTGGAGGRDHYSYTVYADAAMAERFDALRFGGPIGQLVAESQERQIVEALSPLEGRRVLDVGTGTGRAALALACRGAHVVGVDASIEMLRVARRRAAAAGAQVTFEDADAQALAFADRGFDAVVCLRVLMHVPDWRKALSELCRVSSGLVVFDYPALWSAAALHAAARSAAHLVNPRVEAYRVFTHRAIAAALAASGYRVTSAHPLFTLPIALHKRVNHASWTTSVEGVLSRAGITRIVGSPVTVTAERCRS
jgi:2-polyprenyl-3-methyl-5-hydroxy-6-metoxy-1,4-benzoquinol methylase